MPDPTGESAGSFYGIVQLSAVHQENIQKAVVVVVEQGDAAAHGFDQVFLRRGGIAMREIDPGGVEDPRSAKPLRPRMPADRGAETTSIAGDSI